MTLLHRMEYFKQSEKSKLFQYDKISRRINTLNKNTVVTGMQRYGL